MKENNIGDELSQIKFGDRPHGFSFVGDKKGLLDFARAINAICPDKRFVDLTPQDKELLIMMVRPIKPRND